MCLPVLPTTCSAKKVITGALADGVENFKEYVVETFERGMAALGTLWINIQTPPLSTDTSDIADHGHPAQAESLITVLNYTQWIGYALAILAMIILGATLATRMRSGEGIAAVGKIGWILCGVILIGAAGGVASSILGSHPTNAGGVVGFLQSTTWYFVICAVSLSVIIGGIRMMWEMRGEPGRELLRSLLTVAVVSGAGVTVVNLLTAASDHFAIWILNESLECKVISGTCFTRNMLGVLALTGPIAPAALIVILLGLIAFIACCVQIFVMIGRSGVLVMLAGLLPLSASATNTQLGKTWFLRSTAWLLALVFYKPAAAIVYATGFRLTGTNIFKEDDTGLIQVLMGLALLCLAIFALPALMRLITPAVGALATAAAGGAALGLLGAVATGAVSVSMSGRGSPTETGGESSGPTGNDTSAGPGGGAGQEGPQGSDGSSPNGGGAESGRPGGGGADGANGETSGSGASSGQDGADASAAGGSGAAATESSAGATGAGSGAAAGGTTAGSGAAAGAAGGPIGAAAGAAIEGGKAAADTAKGLADDTAGNATEGDGPSGSQ